MTTPSLLPSFQLWVNVEKKYVLKAYGDIADIYWDGREFDTLNEALWGLEKEVTFSDGGRSLDPEDDMVEIVEVTAESATVVWRFWGWHFSVFESELPQGRFLGHEKSVYEELMNA